MPSQNFFLLSLQNWHLSFRTSQQLKHFLATLRFKPLSLAQSQMRNPLTQYAPFSLFQQKQQVQRWYLTYFVLHRALTDTRYFIITAYPFGQEQTISYLFMPKLPILSMEGSTVLRHLPLLQD